MITTKVIAQTTTDGFLKLTKSKKDWKKTLKLIPCGVQTLSKAPSKFVEGVFPIYLESANGAYVFDGEENRFIDYPLGLGAITLGYNYPEVNNAIKKQLERAIILTLPSILETRLAETLKDLIPSCEMVRFVKTGSEATSAAIKIARAYTGRSHIAFCGYHGWHDWYTVNTPKNKGIPDWCMGHLTKKFNYNDPQSLKNITKEYKLAAVIIEPYVFEEPKDNFLKEVARITKENNALLIFDEIVSGFRTPKISAQKYFKVTPDISTFGKGMANGMPISFVCGRKEVMRELEGDCFVSSTFGGELLSIAASLETIKIIKDYDVPSHMEFMGKILKDGYNEIAKELGVETSCIGYPWRTFFMFPSEIHKSLFWQECLIRGILFGYAQFVSYSHKEPEIFYTLEVIREALKVCKKNWKKPLKALKGKPAQQVFRLVVR